MQKTFVPWSVTFLVALLVGGCGSSKRVENQFDPPSLMRLNAIDDDASVVVACRLATLPETLPSEDLHELTRVESALLVEIPKTELAALGELPGLEQAAVWGDSRTVAKMDPGLKDALLAAWHRGDTRPIQLLARFAEGTSGIEEKLAAHGAPPVTVAGPVATLHAEPDAILRALALPDLVSLSLARTLSPLGDQ